MYRNYHARITTSPRGAETPVVTLVSFFVADCGEGTKAAARELIRQHDASARIPQRYGP